MKNETFNTIIIVLIIAALLFFGIRAINNSMNQYFERTTERALREW